MPRMIAVQCGLVRTWRVLFRMRAIEVVFWTIPCHPAPYTHCHAHTPEVRPNRGTAVRTRTKSKDSRHTLSPRG